MPAWSRTKQCECEKLRRQRQAEERVEEQPRAEVRALGSQLAAALADAQAWVERPVSKVHHQVRQGEEAFPW